MSSQSFSRPGAVDLSALNGGGQPQQSTPGAAGGGFVIEVTEATFQSEVLTRSMSVPVVIDFWATWCEPCKTLSPILERLAAQYEGRFVLAKIDVDANQAIAQAAQVQSIPTVVAVLRGQLVPLFQGAIPEAQAKQVIDQLLQMAVANGVAGRSDPIPGAGGPATAEDEVAEEPVDPRFEAAYDAINAGDFDKAAEAYQQVLAESPADAEAKAGLAQVELLRRTAGVDAAATVAAADANPTDVDTQLLAADIEVVSGQVDKAFDRLIGTVRRVFGDDRERVRVRVVELFDIVGGSDPRVVKARSALASALF
ncbi:tetratricopeptide repeat protein [Jiangella aurantiaca]|uniref:Tetratricopeptide repeat protein n=1 Tax=Jiangella aurantiaca TaxID=2530373 RepID=A0A4R4ZYH1_9ACTN|nr:tetratricopeptide repeat protein [Jiangella aurantiaca]TDD64085.1 tetratricopeptide repeat protein [Jiangella aurantiaca]